MNKYKAFYRGRTTEVQAATSLSAQTQAAALFRALHRWQVTVVLIERADGSQVTHSTSSIG